MTYKELLTKATDNNGNFIVEPNDTTEICVSYTTSEIIVKQYRFKNQLTPIATKSYSCLYGMLGMPSMEDTFNEIMREFI